MNNPVSRCILCDVECTSENDRRDVRWFHCPQCGKFGITHELEINTRSDVEDRKKAAMLASERHVRHRDSFVLSDSYTGIQDGMSWISFDEFMSGFPKSAIEMIDRSLLNLAEKITRPSEKIKLAISDCYLFFSSDTAGMLYVSRQMNEMGWISNLGMLPGDITIEAKGWQKVESLKIGKDLSYQQAFVAMWFDNSMRDVYEKGIRPAVESSGKIRCVRVDQLEHNNKICDQIVAEIMHSRYVIADFTGNRGGVYFEAGLAQGLGLPVIWTVNCDHLQDVHFDTRQYNHIVYSTPEDLFEKLLNRIAATIKK